MEYLGKIIQFTPLPNLVCIFIIALKTLHLFSYLSPLDFKLLRVGSDLFSYSFPGLTIVERVNELMIDPTIQDGKCRKRMEFVEDNEFSINLIV